MKGGGRRLPKCRLEPPPAILRRGVLRTESGGASSGGVGGGAGDLEHFYLTEDLNRYGKTNIVY